MTFYWFHGRFHLINAGMKEFTYILKFLEERFEIVLSLHPSGLDDSVLIALVISFLFSGHV